VSPDARELRADLLAGLRARVPFDAYAWVLTDPETGVGTSPLAEVPALDELPGLVRCRYLSRAHRWTARAAGTATALSTAPGGPAAGDPWVERLAGLGVRGVASTVCRDRHGLWAFLDLWRFAGPFADREVERLARFGDDATPRLRAALAEAFTGPAAPSPALPPPTPPPAGEGPAVLMLDDELTPLARTPATEAHLRALLPTEADRSPVPAAAFNVAAQLLAVEQGVDAGPPWARVPLGGGRWATLRAARLVGEPAIAVGIEPTPPAERTTLYARVVGLTTREAELLGHLVGGGDTHELAARLHLSQHTVQDHLKSIFAKAGVRTRRALVARATG
jgi:DNA-binding CsgD family transcriptional regulator